MDKLYLSHFCYQKLLPKYFTGYPPVDIFVHENVLTKNQIIKKLAKNKFKINVILIYILYSAYNAIASCVILPYWDWTKDNKIDSPIWDEDFIGGNGRDEGWKMES